MADTCVNEVSQSLNASLVFENPRAFTRLPNYGVYSTVYEKHAPQLQTQLLSPYEYSWGSAVPKQWRRLTKRKFVRRSRLKRNQSFEYLSETQKFIHQLQCAPSPAPAPKAQRKSAIMLGAKGTLQMRCKTRQAMYTMMYVGEIDGDLGSTCVTVPMSRPNTSVAKQGVLCVLGDMRRCQSQAFPRMRSSAVTTLALPAKQSLQFSSHGIQTEPNVIENRDGLSGWTGTRRSRGSELSEECQALKPIFMTEAKSAFEQYLKGTEQPDKGRIKRGKRLRLPA